MSKKFLDLANEDLVKYTIKIDKNLLSKYRELANLTDKQILQTMTKALEDYIEDKVVFNTYLDSYGSFYINIPYNLLVKDFVTKKTYDDVYNLKEFNKKTDFKEIIQLVTNFYADEINGTIEEARLLGFDLDLDTVSKDDNYYKYFIPDLDTLELYKVNRVPNNLDKWDNAYTTYSSYYRLGDLGHSGIELLIIPEIAEYTDDFTNCLYCFYMELWDKELTVVNVEYVEALDLFGEADNEYYISLINNIYTNLKEAKNGEEVKALADFYNTGNIVKISSINAEDVKPIKLLASKRNELSINYYDKELAKKVDNLEQQNQELKEEIANLEETINNNLDKIAKD